MPSAMRLRRSLPVTLMEAKEEAFESLRTLRPGFCLQYGRRTARGVARSPDSGDSGLPADPVPRLRPLTLAFCLDKARTKEILAYNDSRPPPFALIRSMEEFEETRVRFPPMVKPLHEGSSKGIYNSCVVRNPEDLEREVRTILDAYHEPALVEEFLPGREFTVAILGNGDDLRVLPIVEIRFDALPAGMNPIYSYEAKWVWDRSDKPLEIFTCPASIDEPLAVGDRVALPADLPGAPVPRLGPHRRPPGRQRGSPIFLR